MSSCISIIRPKVIKPTSASAGRRESAVWMDSFSAFNSSADTQVSTTKTNIGGRVVAFCNGFIEERSYTISTGADESSLKVLTAKKILYIILDFIKGQLKTETESSSTKK